MRSATITVGEGITSLKLFSIVRPLSNSKISCVPVPTSTAKIRTDLDINASFLPILSAKQPFYYITPGKMRGGRETSTLQKGGERGNEKKMSSLPTIRMVISPSLVGKLALTLWFNLCSQDL